MLCFFQTERWLKVQVCPGQRQVLGWEASFSAKTGRVPDETEELVTLWVLKRGLSSPWQSFLTQTCGKPPIRAEQNVVVRAPPGAYLSQMANSYFSRPLLRHHSWFRLLGTPHSVLSPVQLSHLNGGSQQGSFQELPWPYFRDWLPSPSQTKEILPSPTPQQHFANCYFLEDYLTNHLKVKPVPVLSGCGGIFLLFF